MKAKIWQTLRKKYEDISGGKVIRKKKSQKAVSRDIIGQ